MQRLVAQTLETEAYLRANLLIQLAGYFTDLFWWPQGVEAVSQALMLLETLPKGSSAAELVFDALYLHAVILKDKESFAEAVAIAEKATKLAADQGDWERVLKGLNLQGAVCLKEERLDEAKDLFWKAWRRANNELPGRTIAIASVGIVQRKMGETDMAEFYLETALHEAKKQPSLQYQLLPIINTQLAILYNDTGRYAEADNTVRVDYDLLNFVRHLVAAGFKANTGFQYASTLSEVEHAKRLLKLDFGEYHPALADCYLTEAWGRMSTGGLRGSELTLQDIQQRNKPAIEILMSDATRIYEKYYPGNAEKLNYVQFIRCHLYWEFNDWLKAETELNTLISRMANVRNPNPAMLAKCYALLSRSLQEQGRWQEAIFPADKALALTADLVGLSAFESKFINFTKGGINQLLN